ncbi:MULTISPECIES: DUF7521 family protein [Haloarcula]|uniref:Uncharacterized protein n=1 Tax=Haloarcula pellucida TaxID=1427151 RepID=A0A830GH42_9EURY|nr:MULTISPECIES: hypothetical protein [Halomicroarcula]MBX0347235.1 hypothetical protein [Halomicroarcula pellucida]MDS0276890.1 hypothetical protein [Halomicroarcula sp. S1AR25-4]QIO22693.1 hypothetical protein G9465_10175 [Haloarcula sp. JP-L23]GGN87665.1 hypothetical protein GCM10009030_06560 [Halomicroarcula pellucida]
MNGQIPLVVLGFKTVTLLLGGLITYFAAKAAVKSRSRGLTYLAVGFGTVTSGSLLAGVADQVFGFDTQTALVFENALTMVGFAVVAYSLYVAGRSSLGGR